MTDKEILAWIRDRLIHRYGESPHVDFIHRLNLIIDAKEPTTAEQENMKLKSGRELDPYANVIGIDGEGAVYGGYDEHYEGAYAARPDWIEPGKWESWTADEKTELANLMIARWREYKRLALSR